MLFAKFLLDENFNKRTPHYYSEVYFLESDISWMVDQMLGPKYMAIQVTTTLSHWTYFCVDSWRTSYTARQLNICGTRQHITNAVAKGKKLGKIVNDLDIC